MTSNSDDYVGKLKKFQTLKQEKERRYLTTLRNARTDFQSFLEYTLEDETVGGTPIQLAEIHKSWIHHIYFCWSHGLHAAILAPYGHGKTSIVGVGLPLFCFGIDPTLRITLASANDRIARERLVLIRKYIESNEKYHEVFPNVKADMTLGWTMSQFFLSRSTFSKDPSLTACGATGSIIGKRNDLIIFDDINNAKNTLEQPKMRETIWTKYTGEFMSRMEPGGKILIIATRWHERDLIGNILADAEMRRSYGFLIQRITDDFTGIECETIIPAAIPEKVDQRIELAHLFKLRDHNVI